MRLKLFLPSCVVFTALAIFPRPGVAQNPDTMMPEASAAKARQILSQMVDAMGGQAYLSVRESQCSGRVSGFGHNNDLTSYLEFKEYWRFPDKNRVEFGKKGNIIDVFSGRDGWTMDHDGVSEEPIEKIAEFQDRLMKSPNHLLRDRMKEEGLYFRYGGSDLIDLRPIDWVEISDRQEHTYRFGVQRDGHLMVRFTVLTRDSESREITEEVTSYSNYHPLDGVQTALQVARTRNDRRVFQAFYDSCTYRPRLASDFFTRAALDQRFEEVGSRADKKKAGKSKD